MEQHDSVRQVLIDSGAGKQAGSLFIMNLIEICKCTIYTKVAYRFVLHSL